MDTEAQRVTSLDVVALAGTQLGVIDEGEPLSLDQLETLTDDVSTSIPANTAYIDITCTKLEPGEAQACADAFANAYKADRESLARRSADAARQNIEREIDASEERISELQAKLAATPGARRDHREPGQPPGTQRRPLESPRSEQICWTRSMPRSGRSTRRACSS